MRARALSAWVSHRSVRTSISLLSCNHSSRLGLPSKPAHQRETQAWSSVFVIKQWGPEPLLNPFYCIFHRTVQRLILTKGQSAGSAWTIHTDDCLAKTSDTWFPAELRETAVISSAYVQPLYKSSYRSTSDLSRQTNQPGFLQPLPLHTTRSFPEEVYFTTWHQPNPN